MPDEGPERFSPGGGGDYKMFNGLELAAKDRSCPFWYITGTCLLYTSSVAQWIEQWPPEPRA